MAAQDDPQRVNDGTLVFFLRTKGSRVELGKQLASKILNEFDSNAIVNHDASTANLLMYYKKNRD